ncbi:MAG: hypothetical protein WKF58_03935 [Ilumatobacteraceae bacterium]
METSIRSRSRRRRVGARDRADVGERTQPRAIADDEEERFALGELLARRRRRPDDLAGIGFVVAALAPDLHLPVELAHRSAARCSVSPVRSGTS